MPSFDHEGLVELFRAQPSLVIELLRSAGLEVPANTTIDTDTANLTELNPAEYRADLVVLFRHDHHREGDDPNEPPPVALAVVIEVQLLPSISKLFTWPAYQTVSRARYRCPVIVLVYTPSRETARWARQPVALGGGSSFTACVMGPAAFPKIDSIEKARENVELAVLSAVAHANDPPEAAARSAAIAAEATIGLPGPVAALYWDLIESALGEAATAVLEHLMETQAYIFKGPTALKNQAIGRSEGEVEGRKEGRKEGLAEAVLRFLEARNLTPSVEQRARIKEQKDLSALETWVARAATVNSVDELLQD